MLSRGQIYSWLKSAKDNKHLWSDTRDGSSYFTFRLFSHLLDIWATSSHSTSCLQPFLPTSGWPLGIRNTYESSMKIAALGQYANAFMHLLVHSGRVKKKNPGRYFNCLQEQEIYVEIHVWQKTGNVFKASAYLLPDKQFCTIAVVFCLFY